MLLKIKVFWDVMVCHWICGSQHVKGSQCVPLQVAELKARHRDPPECPYSVTLRQQRHTPQDQTPSLKLTLTPQDTGVLIPTTVQHRRVLSLNCHKMQSLGVMHRDYARN